MTSIEWFIEQIKEYDFAPPSNNEEYVIVMPKWIFNAKRDQALEMEKQYNYITHEEIDAAAPQGNPTLEEGFVRGAKWYREQLKTK